MLPRTNRLKKKEDIARVFKIGTGLHSPFFSAKYAKNSQEGPRIGFSFSKKHIRTAVGRNRLKRRILGEIKKIPDFFEQGVDMVFFLPRAPHACSQKELQKTIENFTRRVYNRDIKKK